MTAASGHVRGTVSHCNLCYALCMTDVGSLRYKLRHIDVGTRCGFSLAM